MRYTEDIIINIDNAEKNIAQMLSTQNNTCSVNFSGSGESIAERRRGVEVLKIDTSMLPPRGLPCLTISPGISPTALLESPILISHAQAPSSPTVGTFSSENSNRESPLLKVEKEDGDVGSSFGFEPPVGNYDSPSNHFGSKDQGSSDCNVAHRASFGYQALRLVEPSIVPAFPADLRKESSTRISATEQLVDLRSLKNVDVNTSSAELKINGSNSVLASDQISQQISERDQKGIYQLAGSSKSSDDGYCWRKYGQKQVKGSEYPRSYYKCTSPNCPVKKKIERTHDGQITEIIYKGSHNHPKPQSWRLTVLKSPVLFDESSKVDGTSVNNEGGSVWRSVQLSSSDGKPSSEGRGDGMEKTASGVTELSDSLSTTPGRSVVVNETVGSSELSSALASRDDDEDEANQGSNSLGGDADNEDGEDFDSNKRKRESFVVETNLSSRSIREPRVMIQIESDIDVLDDGFHWRKYGQKVVKGNPNPRSYYKCTTPGCSVRKHVERAAHSKKYVITTYEGKHNHERPVARDSSRVNLNNGSLPLPVSTPLAMTLPNMINIPKTNDHIQGPTARFDIKQEYHNKYVKSSLGMLNDNMKYKAPAMVYQSNFSQMQGTATMAYGSFGVNYTSDTNMQAGSVVPLQDFPGCLPLSSLTQAIYPLPLFDSSNNGRQMAQSFVSGLQMEDDMRLVRPKQEQIEGTNTYDNSLPYIGNANASSSTSVFGQLRPFS